MTRLASWLLVLLLSGAFVGTVAYALWLRAEAGKGMPAYSVYSEEPDGLAEAARTVQRLGWQPVAVTRRIQHTRYRGLLVLVEPATPSLFGAEPGLSEADARALLRWVDAGNTLLYCGRHANALHAELGVSLTTDDTDTDPHRADLGDGGAYLDDVRRIVVEGRDRLGGKRGLPLWYVEGRPGALLLRHGKGRVLLVADPSLLTRRGLGEPDDERYAERKGQDNVVFLYNVAWRDARDGKVYFDEYHHGLRAGEGAWGYLAYHRAHWVLVPLLLLAAVAAWSFAVRLGPPVPTPRELRADAVDYASAVARIYERAGARRLLARALVRGFLGALTRHLHLRRNALPAEVLRAWQRQHPGESGQRLQGLLRGVTALRKGDVSEQQLLEWSRAFDSFQAEMMRAR